MARKQRAILALKAQLISSQVSIEADKQTSPKCVKI